MKPSPPARCRAENRWRLIASLLPAGGSLLLLMFGQGIWAAALFGVTFCIVCYGCIQPRAQLFGPSRCRLPEAPTRARGVWITLDDGPDPDTTPGVLDLLDQYDVKAGFFLIGTKALRHPHLVREIAARGHLIGNHSQTHPAGYFWALPPGRMWVEIAGCGETLRSILGKAPSWFRPPVGHHNPFVAPVLRALGLKMAIWNCRGFDGVDGDVERVLRSIRRGLQPGAIVLLHESMPGCLEVLERTLVLVRELGLQPVLPEDS